MASNFRAQPTVHFTRTGNWSSGLCDCFDGCPIGDLIYGQCCLPCLASENAARLDNNPNFCGCCYPGGSAKNRLQAQAQFGIQGDVCSAICVAVFCTCCSELQIKRELDRYLASPQQQTMK